jgi:FtsZ-binding cell division protein ZapB
VNNEGWLTTERELNDRRAAMAAELQRVTEERDQMRDVIAVTERERDDARAHRERLNRELATMAREHNSLTAQLAAVTAERDRYRDRLAAEDADDPARVAVLDEAIAERDRLRALIDAGQPTLASELLACRERNAAIAAQSDRYRDERDELAVEAEELREAKAPDRLAKAIAALRADVAGLTVARDCLGKELSDARTAYGTLRNAFTMGKQSGWTARLSGTVLARCDAQAMREPGAEAEADPVAAEREQAAMCRHCLWDIVRDGGRWRVGLDADDPFACEGPADGHAPLAPDGGPR